MTYPFPSGTLQKVFSDAVDLRKQILGDASFEEIMKRSAGECIRSLQSGGKILFCGNGGSAADAQHLAAELSGRFAFDRPPLPAEALHVNTSYLTAVANDYSYDVVYSRWIRAWGKKGDVLVALSTGGNSPNVINALKEARSLEMFCLGMSGRTGGEMKAHCQEIFCVPSDVTARIQEVHITLGHVLCEVIEEVLFKSAS